MSRKAVGILLKCFAILAFAAMLYHIIGVIKPFDATPAWRHGLFVGINIICIYGFIKKPYWFIWFFALLMLQQFYSHGSHFMHLLSQQKFGWIDFCVLLLMPAGFILLFIEKRLSRNT
jgi:hypothetical protein